MEQKFVYSANSDTHEHQCVHGVLFRKSEPGVLIQPPTIFIGDAITELNVQRNYANFIRVTSQGICMRE